MSENAVVVFREEKDHFVLEIVHTIDEGAILVEAIDFL